MENQRRVVKVLETKYHFKDGGWEAFVHEHCPPPHLIAEPWFNVVSVEQQIDMTREEYEERYGPV